MIFYKYKNSCLFGNYSLNLLLNFSSFTPSNELFFELKTGEGEAYF